MSLSPENSKRAKELLLSGIALTAGTYALRHHKAVGKKIRAVGVWESGRVVMDYIGKQRRKSIRLAGMPVYDSNNEIVDIEVESDDLSSVSLLRLERLFTDDKKERTRLFIAELLARTRLYK